ncbi:hypothetical protein D3C72_1736670 [compost metagenome]
MCFSRLRLFFDLIRILEREVCFISFLIKGDVTIIFFTLLINQSANINSLTVFEFLILLIIKILTSKNFRDFLRLVLLSALCLLIGVTPVKQELYKTFISIELYGSIKSSPFLGNHPFYIKWFAFQ